MAIYPQSGDLEDVQVIATFADTHIAVCGLFPENQYGDVNKLSVKLFSVFVVSKDDLWTERTRYFSRMRTRHRCEEREGSLVWQMTRLIISPSGTGRNSWFHCFISLWWPREWAVLHVSGLKRYATFAIYISPMTLSAPDDPPNPTVILPGPWRD